MSNLRNQKPYKINQIDTSHITYGEISGSNRYNSKIFQKDGFILITKGIKKFKT